VNVTITLDTTAFRRDLARASDAIVRRVMPKAINRTAFEILDAERTEAAHSFMFAGPATRTYLAGRGSFRFDGATADKLEARITPRQQERAQAILAKQQRGATVTPGQDESIEAGGMLAIPVGARRGARGRVRSSELPGALLRKGGRGYIRGRALLVRNRRTGDVRVMYALAPRVTIPARFDFYRVARETALREFPRKASEEFAKARLR
jgi:hypothetical protein